MGGHAAYNKLVVEHNYPYAVSRSCSLCKFGIAYRTGMGGGRGNGFVRGNKARGEMIAHLKSEHPKEYAEAMA